jgi:predicted MFS family arabinose efflux permease
VLIVGGCGILLLTKLGGYLFDKWTAGAPFYIMALLNIVAFIAAIVVILIDRATPKIQLGDDIDEPLLSDPEDHQEP